VDLPFPSVTGSGNHHALIIPQLNGKALLIFMRMLTWRELARAQSFTDEYQFTGTIEQIKKQIGNAVPRQTAKALTKAVLSN
jgi:DNA (cytosine-5)-methyltransferase 1